MCSIGGKGGFRIASASTPSVNEPAKDLSLVQTIQLKPMMKAHVSVRMVSSGTSDVAFTVPSTVKILTTWILTTENILVLATCS